jgi:NitT/TauT family transport system ATP-binding protein
MLGPTHIRVDDLVKVFPLPTGVFVAVDRMRFEVREGEFFCLVGPSGCGKTTVLRILAGLETKSGGEVTIHYRQGQRPRTAMVFQEQSIYPWMTVEGNVTFALRSRPLLTAAARRDVVQHYLERVGLTGFARAYPHQLSGGMKQRVSIARAFAVDPEILLMDEPFAALDEQNRLLLQDELLRIWEESRRTVVYITHSIDEAVALSDRVLVMTAAPGRVKTIVPIELKRPRSIPELRRDGAFGEYVYHIWNVLRDEVLRARGLEARAGASR